MVALGKSVNDQFGKLGIPTEMMNAQLSDLQKAQTRTLNRLKMGYAQAALKTNKFGSDLDAGRIKIPAAFSLPAPSAILEVRRPFVGSTYYRDDSTRHPSADNPFRTLMHPRKRRGAMMNRKLQQNPDTRARFGTAVGALVMADGRSDGVISIQRDTAQARHAMAAQTGQAPIPQHPMYSGGSGGIWAIMMAMDQAIIAEAARLGVAQSTGGGGNGNLPGLLDAMGAFSLKGDSSSSSGFGISGMTGNSGPNETSAGSLDIKSMQLKRMIDKKTQMMDLYNQTITKYNESAKNIINNLRA